MVLHSTTLNTSFADKSERDIHALFAEEGVNEEIYISSIALPRSRRFAYHSSIRIAAWVLRRTDLIGSFLRRVAQGGDKNNIGRVDEDPDAELMIQTMPRVLGSNRWMKNFGIKSRIADRKVVRAGGERAPRVARKGALDGAGSPPIDTIVSVAGGLPAPPARMTHMVARVEIARNNDHRTWCPSHFWAGSRPTLSITSSSGAMLR